MNLKFNQLANLHGIKNAQNCDEKNLVIFQFRLGDLMTVIDLIKHWLIKALTDFKGVRYDLKSEFSQNRLFANTASALESGPEKFL